MSLDSSETRSQGLMSCFLEDELFLEYYIQGGSMNSVDCLSFMPQDILIAVLLHLDIQSIARLAACSRHFQKQIMENQLTWEQLCRRAGYHVLITQYASDWKKCFYETYQKEVIWTHKCFVRSELALGKRATAVAMNDTLCVSSDGNVLYFYQLARSSSSRLHTMLLDTPLYDRSSLRSHCLYHLQFCGHYLIAFTINDVFAVDTSNILKRCTVDWQSIFVDDHDTIQAVVNHNGLVFIACDSSITAVDPKTRACVALDKHRKVVKAMAIHPETHSLLSWDGSGNILLWDLSHVSAATLLSTKFPCRSLNWPYTSPAGIVQFCGDLMVTSVPAEGAVVIWSTKTWETRHILPNVNPLAIVLDDKVMYVASSAPPNTEIITVDTVSGRRTAPPIKIPTQGLSPLALFKSGLLLILLMPSGYFICDPVQQTHQRIGFGGIQAVSTVRDNDYICLVGEGTCGLQIWSISQIEVNPNQQSETVKRYKAEQDANIYFPKNIKQFKYF